MSAPIKPWERGRMNMSHNANTNNGGLPSCCVPGGGATGAPPPLPTRPAQQVGSMGTFGGPSGYSGPGSYGGYYGSYGNSMYSPMYNSSMYGSGMYGGYSMNRFTQDPNNSFVRMAEENSRQAFQSIEGIVQAFGSVSMMLESTLHAVYNSFRAVIGVADHFSRMKSHFTQIFSALAVIRSLKWLYRKLLVLLRLRDAGVSEEAWAAAADAALGSAGGPDGKARSNWPIMMFFAVVFGGPWLIWRLLSSLAKVNEGSGWASGQDAHFLGEAQFDFTRAQQGELSFTKGQKIVLAPKELQPRVRGWLLASVDGKNTGLVPANYVKVLGKRDGLVNLPPKASEAGGCCSSAPSDSVISPAVNAPAVNPAGTCCSSGPASSVALCTGDTQPHGSRSNQQAKLNHLSYSGELQENFPQELEELNPVTPPVSELDASDILSSNRNLEQHS